MKKEKKYIFETEYDFLILEAVKKFIGQSSLSSRKEDGLTEEEAIRCEQFYDFIGNEKITFSHKLGKEK